MILVYPCVDRQYIDNHIHVHSCSYGIFAFYGVINVMSIVGIWYFLTFFVDFLWLFTVCGGSTKIANR